MHVLPDDDEGVGQRAQDPLILRLRRRVAPEHSLYVEPQHQAQETASLPVLRGRAGC